MKKDDSGGLFYSVALIVVGLLLVWWASEQFHQLRQIAGSLFRYSTWRLLAWVLTLVAGGFVFGLALLRRSTVRVSTRTVLIWSCVPVLMLASFITTLTTEWWFGLHLPGAVLRFATSPSTVTVWAMVLGFSLAAVATPVVGTRATPREPTG